MKTPNQILLILITVAVGCGSTRAQGNPPAKPTPNPTPAATQQVPRPAAFSLADYGVAFQSDPRLIVVMAALEAAGFDAVPAGRAPSVFRARLRKDQADLDRDLRDRLQSFYQHNKLPPPATAADQAARYVSLAFAIGPPPGLEPPDRSDDLPSGVLEVLDFAPLVSARLSSRG
jgi:hypothetical protein